MRKFVTLAVLIIAIGILPALAGEVSTTLVHPGVDGVTPPQVKAKSRIQPYYPATARASRALGTVVIAAAVLQDGKVGETRVVSCDHPNVGFEESALAAVKRWKFSPATKDGQPVDSYTFVHMQFSPPSGRMGGGGVVSVDTFVAADLPTGLPGASKPITPPGGSSLAAAGDGRAYPQVFIRPPCGPTTGRCLYDRNALLREAKRRQGEPGLNRPITR